MIKKFFTLLFGDWGLLIASTITAVLSAILFPLFMAQLGGGIIKTAMAIFLGIFAVGFYASSFLSAFTLTIRSGRAKKWLLMSLALLVVVADIVILIVNII